jgi:hypothetical protein
MAERLRLRIPTAPQVYHEVMKFALCLGLILVFGACMGSLPLQAADWGWVLSVPHAISGEQVYKVRIVEIDGQPQKELIRYAVPGGSHTVRVRMLLEVTWEPEFAEAPRGPGEKELDIEIEAGRTYLLAAHLDVDAPIEAQLDRSYWEPIIYQVD